MLSILYSPENEEAVTFCNIMMLYYKTGKNVCQTACKLYELYEQVFVDIIRRWVVGSEVITVLNVRSSRTSTLVNVKTERSCCVMQYE